MDIRIYQLTELGSRAARGTSNPNEPAYKIISFLDFMGTATTEQIVDHVMGFFPEVSSSDVNRELHRLQTIGVVEEITRKGQQQGQESGESVQQQYQHMRLNHASA